MVENELDCHTNEGRKHTGRQCPAAEKACGEQFSGYPYHQPTAEAEGKFGRVTLVLA